MQSVDDINCKVSKRSFPHRKRKKHGAIHTQNNKSYSFRQLAEDCVPDQCFQRQIAENRGLFEFHYATAPV